jgi:hypothetical protein
MIVATAATAAVANKDTQGSIAQSFVFKHKVNQTRF